MRTLATKKTVAQMTGLHPESVMRLARQGAFPKPVKFGPSAASRVRFDVAEVEQWVEAKFAERGQQAVAA